MSTNLGNKSKSSKNLEINFQNNTKKKTIQLIKEYLSSQPEQLKKLDNVSKTLYEVIDSFIEFTKDYSNKLEILALKIIPNYTTEGQLAQAVQGILLFYSEGLNNLISTLEKENIKPKDGEINNILDEYNNYKNKYYSKIREAIIDSEKFKKELESYQEYLVINEYNEHMSKGDKKNIDDEIDIENFINNRAKNGNIEENEKKEENNNDIYEKIGSNDFNILNDFGLNSFDNEKEVIESQKLFFSNINESNDILIKIKEFLSKEKTYLRKNIFNICDCLIEGLLKCTKEQKENYDIQNEVIKKLTNNLKFVETDKNKIKPALIKLKYLEIYTNYIKEKDEISNNKKSSLTTDDLLIKKTISNKTKKANNADEPLFNTDNIIRNTISFNNQIHNKISKEQAFEKFKSMVIKLNRDEILRIFEKIKSTNIILAESDLKKIEEEVNYKSIHEILVSVFIHVEKYTEKEKKILFNFFEKDRIYIVYFIKVLNDHRAKGYFILSELTLKYLGEIFKFINNLIVSKNDMELFKFIFILSMTYYYASEKDNVKFFLFSYIKDHPDYQKVKFWEDYLHELVYHDLKGNSINQLDLSNKDLDKLNKEEKEKIINCIFSNFISVAKAMADFRMDKKFVRDFVEKNKDNYILTKSQIDNICMVFDASLNENEVNYNGDFLSNQIQNNDNSIKNKEETENNKEKNEKERNENKKEEKKDNIEEKEVNKEKNEDNEEKKEINKEQRDNNKESKTKDKDNNENKNDDNMDDIKNKNEDMNKNNDKNNIIIKVNDKVEEENNQNNQINTEII